MSNFITYEKATGRILGYGITIDTNISYMDTVTQGSFIVPSDSDYSKTHYVLNGLLTPKGVNPTYLSGNTLYDVPANSSLILNGIISTVGGTYILQLTANIIYEIIVISIPYMDSVFTIDNR